MKILLIAFGLFFASCSSASSPDPEEPAFIGPLQTQIMEVETEQAIPTALPTATFEPIFERTNVLLLGLDQRAHRIGTGEGNHTDVIVLVSVLETDPIQITAIQFPRNLYLPVEKMEDQWLFAVYGNGGLQGIHHWFERALGISLQAVFVIDMDSFESLIDDLGGVSGRNGAETLAYLRDNDALWDLGGYDQEERVFQVLVSLWDRSRTFFLDDPVAAANVVYARWGDLFKTDLGNIRQIYRLFAMGWKVRNADYELAMVQLEEPAILRGDTPLPVRGMIANADLKEWMACAIDWDCE